MPKLEDLTGKIFDRLTVVAKAPSRGRLTYWSCVCQCGGTLEVQSVHLKRGDTSSCGCLRKELTAEKNRTHGATGTFEHGVWRSMKNRCYTKSHKDYAIYGGRGITICQRWLDSFENFLADMGPAPTHGHSIERRDTNGNYEPGNCSWATPVEQANNRRNTIMLEWNGRCQSMADWARELEINYYTLKQRLRNGWTTAEALSGKRN